MKTLKAAKKIGDDAVRANTGKMLPAWFRMLDQAGAKKWTHKEIVAYLKDKEKVPSWWCQMVTVEYERAHGLRGVYQKADGLFAASASRTLNSPLSRVYSGWAEETQRGKWLSNGKMEVTTARKDKSIRAAWDGNKSRVNIGFYSKGADRCQVAVDHEKLSSAAARTKMKTYWLEALERLEKYLER